MPAHRLVKEIHSIIQKPLKGSISMSCDLVGVSFCSHPRKHRQHSLPHSNGYSLPPKMPLKSLHLCNVSMNIKFFRIAFRKQLNSSSKFGKRAKIGMAFVYIPVSEKREMLHMRAFWFFIQRRIKARQIAFSLALHSCCLALFDNTLNQSDKKVKITQSWKWSIFM